MRRCFSFAVAKLRAEIIIPRKGFLKSAMLKVIAVELVKKARIDILNQRLFRTRNWALAEDI